MPTVRDINVSPHNAIEKIIDFAYCDIALSADIKYKHTVERHKYLRARKHALSC